MNNEKIIAWAVMKDGECLSVRRFEPVASGEAEGVEFVPLVRFAEQPAPMIRGDIRDGLVDDEPAQQEPVAWLHPANATCVTTDPTAYARGIPLYTSPPANKPWVGLTDEQIVTLFNKTLNGKPLDVNSMTNFARAIEAKLKEKNT